MAHDETQRRLAVVMRRWAPVLVVVAALLVAGLAAQGAGLQWQEAELPESTGGQDQPPISEPEPEPSLPSQDLEEIQEDGFTLPPWVTWLIFGVLIGIPVLIILLFLARRLVDWLIQAPPGGGEPDPEPQYLHRDFTLVEAAVNAALAEMDLGTDPRSAIMACWVHFERAAEAVGIERESSDTPSDLVGKLLVRHDIERDPLRRLTETYLRARYSPHQVGEADRDQARDALVAIQAQLGVRAGR